MVKVLQLSPIIKENRERSTKYLRHSVYKIYGTNCTGRTIVVHVLLAIAFRIKRRNFLSHVVAYIFGQVCQKLNQYKTLL